MTSVAESVVPAPTLAISVTYDPTAPLTERFTVAVDGSPQTHAAVTGTSGIVQVTLTGGTFAQPPILWSVSPAPMTVVILDADAQTISFQVQEPVSYFAPWAFRINLDDNNSGLKGILSPLIYLIRELQAGDSENITYSPANGSFTLANGFELASELVLVNPIVPATGQTSSIPISLTGATFVTEGLPSPIVWISDEGEPNWIEVQVTGSQSLNLVVSSTGAGQGAGFRIAVQVDDTNQVLSPDPILINATLGDGN